MSGLSLLDITYKFYSIMIVTVDGRTIVNVVIQYDYTCSVMVWAGEAGRTYNIDSANMLWNKYLCSEHFFESDLRTAERIQQNHLAFSYG
jgi:hypothetical protein